MYGGKVEIALGPDRGRGKRKGGGVGERKGKEQF
jgi:hypothetical protein